jgi:class 3 adenylate cyclase/tetratricopeptide (TPR) repeat protein
MFCDLVGSTKLASELDPETYGEVVDGYYQVCGDIIRRYNGFVSQYLGDGILAFFGYPEAGETTAEDAVAAALEILQALSDERNAGDNGIVVEARIGLHSGLVVVTEVGAPERRETHALGDAVNVAARVQSIADPNSVVVTEELRRRLEGAFHFELLGEKDLKGVPEPVLVHRVVAHVPTARRSRERSSGAFVGRRTELTMLSDRWQSAKAGEGQVVLVLGEPGIGKSALLQQLRSDVESDGAWLEVAASRLEQVQPFAVVKKLVERQFDWPADLDADERIAGIEVSLRQVADDPVEGVQLVTDLLGLPTAGRFAPLLVSPEEERRRLMGWMVRWLAAQAAVRPLALVVEDLHWADPSSLETLGATLERVAAVAGLVIMTARLGFVPPWGARSNYTLITLNRLGPDETRVIVRERLGEAGSDHSTVDALADRSDGVPLFAEELARAVSEQAVDVNGRDIPTSLYDSLMARLDRLGPAKEVAQIASAIGREFSFDLLLELGGYAQSDLMSALGQLDDTELVLTRGLAPASTYQFRHVLVQQAAYDSMLRRRRVHLHGQIAQTLTRRADRMEPVAPELLAYHWTEAGEAIQAIEAWRIAAQRSAARSAYAETSAHYERALALLDQLPEEPDRVQRELVLQLGLTDALQMARGFGAPETIVAADRAKKLSEYLGDTQFRLRTLYNLWGTSMSSGEIMSSQVLADELVSLAGELGDEQSSCEAHIAQAGTLYNRGRLVDALDHAETVFDRSSEALAEVVPLSGVVQAALYGGAAAAVLGLTDRARRFLDQIVSALQRSDADPIAQILGSVSRSVVSVWLRDFDTVRASCDELQSVGTQFGIDIIVGWAEIYGGWAGSMIGDATGVDRISAGLAKHVAARQRLGLDHSLGLLAESQLMAGRFDDAFATVADALLLPDQNMQIQHTCELHRLRAELHASTGEYEAARKDFGDALDMATEMGAGLLELRVGAALARFCGTRGKPLEGRALLGSIVARHDVDSFDGQNARAILSDLDNMQMS